ncbi:RNA-directed DNA polymerase, eukaryota [Tanacetum coccineum]
MEMALQGSMNHSTRLRDILLCLLEIHEKEASLMSLKRRFFDGRLAAKTISFLNRQSDEEQCPARYVGILDETPRGSKYWIPDVEDKPVDGTLFESVQHAYQVYKEYAKKVGFKSREIVKETNTKNEKKQRRRRLSCRIGCQAKLVIKLVNGNQYVVDTFVQRHNHFLVDKENLQFLRSCRKLTFSQKVLIHQISNVNICPVMFPRLFALELDKEIVVTNKMGALSVSASFRRDVRDGAERQQWDDLSSIMNSVVLSSSKDRWTCDLSGDGEFKVKVIRNFIDDLFLPSSDVATRWVKFIPIKVNVFSWRARRDRLPTRVNLSRRGVLLDSHLCPLCNAAMEDVQHVFFRCDVARVVLRKICRWWDLDWQEICSFSDWDAWFLSFRLSSRLKSILEATPVKWTKRLIIARSPDSADGIKESEMTKGKKRASTDNKMIRCKKKKGETANSDTKDTCADTKAGPSKSTSMYKFDPVAMEIKLKKASLVVNNEVISEMLGLRNEGDNILMNEVSGNKEMIRDWKEQFDVPEKDITPSIIKSKIRRSTVVEFNFKLNIIMLFANIMGCCKKTGSCEFEILKHISRDTNLCNINWCQYVLDSLPLCKDGWKKELQNNFFCGPVTLLTMIYVDGVQCKSLPMSRRRPPTSDWSGEVLKEREAEEIASGGFGLGEKEGPFVEEDEIGFSDDLEGFGWKLENYIETICKNKTCFEKTLAIGLEVFPNHDMLIDLEEKYVQVMNLQTGGGNGQNNFQRGNSSASMGKSGEIDKAEILETFERVTSLKLKGKAVDIDDIPISVNASEILFETTNGHRSTRSMMESLAPSTAVEDNILDVWAEQLNFNERLCYASSPLRAFLPTFVVLSADVRYNLFKDYMKKAIVKDQRWMDFKDVELVFIPVSNEGYQFVEVFNLKTNDVLGHTKASAIFTASLNFIRMKCQRKSKSANWGVYALRHIETYMGNMKEKCECGLDVDGRKHTSQINKLRVKYAAKILQSGCNIHHKKVGELLNGK